jgi:hypothetical protein
MQLRGTDAGMLDMISALNISGLRKLRLLRCTSVVPLFQAILEARTNITLESLELELVDKISDDELLFL